MIKPETAGYPIEPVEPDRPGLRPTAAGVACRFDAWLGDDLVRAHPVFLVTTPLKRALELLGGSGFSVGRAWVSRSAFFRKVSPGLRLPRFWWLRVHGEPGADDVGVAPGHSLVVSFRVMEALMAFSVRRAGMCQYHADRRVP